MKTGKRMLSMLLVLLMLVTAMPITVLPKVKAEGTTYQEGDIIEFGSYPQTLVTDDALIEQLNSQQIDWQPSICYAGEQNSPSPDSSSCDPLYYGTMKPVEYGRFADVMYHGKKYRAISFWNYRTPWTTFKLDYWAVQKGNGYYVNNTYWFLYEPIEWIVRSGFIISNSVLDAQAYSNTIYMMNDKLYQDTECTIAAARYDACSLRSWLNNDFYNTAFSEKQKSIMQLMSYNGWKDYVTLCSLVNGTSNYEHAYGTDYAKANGLWVDSNKSSGWWLKNGNSMQSGYQRIRGYDGYQYAGVWGSHFGVRPTIKIDFARLDEAQEPVEKYLSDYQPGYDKYGFKNEYAPAGAADSISIDYYMDVFGVFHGGMLYSEHEDGLKHGVCFGMAASSGMFAQHKDKLSSLYIMNDDTAIQLKQLADAYNPFTTYSTWSGTTLETIIKRAQVYQFSQKVTKERNENVDNLHVLWDAIKDSVDKGEMPVIVNVYNGTYQQKENYHAVLAVGYVELDEDYVIILDNPNYLYGPNQEFSACILIRKDFSAWEMLYLDRNKGLQYTEYSSEKGGLTFNYADVTRVVSTPSLLTMDSNALLIKANELFNTNKTVFPIYATNGDDTGNTNLYWTDEDVNDISLTTTKNTKVSVSSYYSTLGATLPANSTFDSTFEDRNAEAVIDTDAGSPMELTVSRAGEANRLETIRISGTAENGDIQIQSDEDKITIDGLNDITATLEKDNIAKSASVNVSDGRSVNITIDEQNNDVI